jgi:hypothetical protein
MRKKTVILLALLLVAFGLSSCAKATAPKAGSAKAADLLNLLPGDSKGVVVVDVHRIMQTEAAGKLIAENKNKAKYDEFVQTTGIDPQKDVFYFVGAALGDIGQKEMDGVALVNLKYKKEKLLALLKKEGGEMTTEEYSGLTIYTGAPKDEKKPVSAVFLDESNIMFGTSPAVKSHRRREKGRQCLRSADIAVEGMKRRRALGELRRSPDAMNRLLHLDVGPSQHQAISLTPTTRQELMAKSA